MNENMTNPLQNSNHPFIRLLKKKLCKKYYENEPIEVLVPDKGWCPGKYIYLSNYDTEASQQFHVIECNSLWYGAIKTPDDKIRKVNHG